MTRLTLSKNHQQPIREPEPDVLPDDPSRDGVTDPVAQEESDHATA